MSGVLHDTKEKQRVLDDAKFLNKPPKNQRFHPTMKSVWFTKSRLQTMITKPMGFASKKVSEFLFWNFYEKNELGIGHQLGVFFWSHNNCLRHKVLHPIFVSEGIHFFWLANQREFNFFWEREFNVSEVWQKAQKMASQTNFSKILVFCWTWKCMRVNPPIRTLNGNNV